MKRKLLETLAAFAFLQEVFARTTVRDPLVIPRYDLTYGGVEAVRNGWRILSSKR